MTCDAVMWSLECSVVQCNAVMFSLELVAAGFFLNVFSCFRVRDLLWTKEQTKEGCQRAQGDEGGGGDRSRRGGEGRAPF